MFLNRFFFVIFFRFQNGLTTAPHMLGNQLNPTSNMHQKMTDHLSNELEAHSIYNNSHDGSPNLMGPQMHHRVVQTVSLREVIQIIYLL